MEANYLENISFQKGKINFLLLLRFYECILYLTEAHPFAKIIYKITNCKNNS